MTESSFSQHPPVQKQNRKADWRLSSHVEIRLLWAGIVIFASCIFLIGYADPSIATYVKTVDLRIYRFFRVITSLGYSAIYLIPFGILCIILRLLSYIPVFQPKKRIVMKVYYSFLFIFSSIAISGVITDIFKFLFGRTRPTLLFKDNYYDFAFFEFSSEMLSFPSGHANTIFALATALFFLLPKGWLLYFSVAVLVGASRVFTGSHYPSDVIAGSYLAVLTTLYIKQYFVFKKIDIFERPR